MTNEKRMRMMPQRDFKHTVTKRGHTVLWYTLILPSDSSDWRRLTSTNAIACCQIIYETSRSPRLSKHRKYIKIHPPSTTRSFSMLAPDTQIQSRTSPVVGDNHHWAYDRNKESSWWQRFLLSLKTQLETGKWWFIKGISFLRLSNFRFHLGQLGGVFFSIYKTCYRTSDIRIPSIHRSCEDSTPSFLLSWSTKISPTLIRRWYCELLWY